MLQESLLGFVLRLPDILSSADLTLNAVNYTRGVAVYCSVQLCSEVGGGRLDVFASLDIGTCQTSPTFLHTR